MSRFEYIKYDDIAMAAQPGIKAAFQHTETMISQLADSRAKSLALTALEESYMWVGKAIRDDQIARNIGKASAAVGVLLNESRDPEPVGSQQVQPEA
jgi:hypothetical protein